MKRRVKILEVSAAFLIPIIKGSKEGFDGRFKVIKNGLPEDAKLVSYRLSNSFYSNIQILVESDSYKEVEEGQEPVMDSPVFESVNTEKEQS